MRLRLPHLECKRKFVDIADSWRDTVGVAKRPELKLAFDAIIDAIESGVPLPFWAYRKGIEDTPDELLQADGFMHLHLGNQNSNELLYLIQYADSVTLLEINLHIHFETQPVGILLKRFHETSVASAESKIAAQVAKHLATAKAVVRRGILPRK